MASALKSKSPTIRRILREAQELSSTPSPDYTAVPLESDLFEWHFTLRGPPSSPYSEGIYHGRITLPPSYPLKPPNFRFVTPNGRFETNREICLSISGHHEETWQPAWGVRTALVALRSFMETSPDGQLGGLATTEERRRMLAKESKGYKCGICGKTNAEIMEECEERTRKHEAEHGAGTTKEVDVPEELSLGFRDEMEKKSKDASAASANGSSTAQQLPANITSPLAAAPAAASAFAGSLPPATTGAVPRIVARTDSMDSETAALAEGFVPTVPTTAVAGRATGAQTQGGGESYPRARPAQGAPQPTGTAGRFGEQHTPQAQVIRPGQGADGVPVWVDRAIMLVIIMLVVMLLKVLFY